MSSQSSDSREEVVYNVEQGPRSVDIFCNWCTQTFNYRETEDVHDFTTCPWCRARLKVPRDKMRRINGARR
jgi:hypothetical protein